MKNLSEKFVVTKARTNRLAISAIPAMQSWNPINVSSELFKDITEINSYTWNNLKQTWKKLKNTLKHTPKQTWNTLETHLKHTWNTPETHLKHTWKYTWNTLETHFINT